MALLGPSLEYIHVCVCVGMDGFGLTGVWCSVRLVAWRSAAVLAGCRCKGGGAGGV